LVLGLAVVLLKNKWFGDEESVAKMIFARRIKIRGRKRRKMEKPRQLAVLDC